MPRCSQGARRHIEQDPRPARQPQPAHCRPRRVTEAHVPVGAHVRRRAWCARRSVFARPPPPLCLVEQPREVTRFLLQADRTLVGAPPRCAPRDVLHGRSRAQYRSDLFSGGTRGDAGLAELEACALYFGFAPEVPPPDSPLAHQFHAKGLSLLSVPLRLSCSGVPYASTAPPSPVRGVSPLARSNAPPGPCLTAAGAPDGVPLTLELSPRSWEGPRGGGA